MSMNRALLLGTVEGEPQIHAFTNGNYVANLVLITSEQWKDGKTGEEKTRYERHKIAIFNDSLVSLIREHVKNGSRLYVEGQIEMRSWADTQGIDRSSIDIVVRRNRGNIIIV